MHVPERIAKYAVQRLLRRGGMGTLYLAYDPDLKRSVAIKVLRSDLEHDELRKRFEREIAAAAGLRHRNIVTIFDTGFHEGEPYLVMEFIPGETLADIIRRREPLTLSRRLQIIEDICAALGHAHAAGIVHRDIKPANVMLDDEGEVKVLDFGIARTAESELTTDGAVMGTLNYMAPEQMSGGIVDHRADIFALGAVMYELLSFTRAFKGGIGDGLIGRVIAAEPAPLNELTPGVPGDVTAIVAKAMEKDPERRFQHARLMRAAVAAARGRNELVRPSAPAAGPVESTVLVARGFTTAQTEAGRSAAAIMREELQYCVDDAQEAMTTGEFERASRLCQEVLAIEPTNGAARAVLERTAARAGTLPATAAWHGRGRVPRVATLVAAVGGVVAIVIALVLIDTGSGGVAPTLDQPLAREPVAQGPVPRSDPDPPPPDVPAEPAPQPLPSPSPVPRTPAGERNASPSPPGETRPSPRGGTPSGPGLTSTPPAPGPAPVRNEPVPPSPDPNPSAGNDDAPKIDDGPKIDAGPSVGSLPPAPAPSPPTSVAAPPPPAPVPSDRQMIGELLNRYATAMTARSLAGVAAVFQMDARVARELEASFDQVRSWRVAVTPPTIKMDPEGVAADVTTTIRYEDIEYVARPGQKGRATALLTLQFRKRNGQWIIVGLNARPQ